MCEKSDLDLHCLSKSFQNISADDKSIRLFVVYAVRVNKGEFSVCMVKQ